MPRRFFSGLAVGAGLTLVGVQLLSQDAEPPVPPPTPSGAQPAATPQRSSSTATAAPTAIVQRDARIGELEKQVRRLQIEGAMAAGRLRSHEGEPQDWPEDTPEAIRPDAFEQRMQEAMAGIEEAELLAVDCDEYPCVAWIQSHSEGEPQEWMDGLTPLHDAAVGELEGAQADVHSYGENPKLQAITVWLDGQDEAVGQRSRYRIDNTAADLRHELAEPAGD